MDINVQEHQTNSVKVSHALNFIDNLNTIFACFADKLRKSKKNLLKKFPAHKVLSQAKLLLLWHIHVGIGEGVSVWTKLMMFGASLCANEANHQMTGNIWIIREN